MPKVVTTTRGRSSIDASNASNGCGGVDGARGWSAVDFSKCRYSLFFFFFRVYFHIKFYSFYWETAPSSAFYACSCPPATTRSRATGTVCPLYYGGFEACAPTDWSIVQRPRYTSSSLAAKATRSLKLHVTLLAVDSRTHPRRWELPSASCNVTNLDLTMRFQLS